MRNVVLLALFGLIGCKDGGDSDSGPGPDTDTDTVPGDAEVVINEFLASNNADPVVDASGAHPDWVELANLGDAAVDLSGAALTDDLLTPRKWLFPDGTTIEAGEYLLLFCDGDDPVDGEIHVSFSLSADGEDLALYSADGDAWTELTFTAQTTDISMARMPDGTGDFETDTSPTGGAENQ